MYKLFLAAGVAALAMSAPATAERGGKDDRRGAKVERGDRGDRAKSNRGERRAERRVERRSERRTERRAERRVERRSEARSEARAERSNDRIREARAERRNDRVREARAERRADRRDDRVREARAERIRDRREEMRDRARDRRQALVRSRDRDDDRRVVRIRDRDDDRRFARIRDWDDRRSIRRDRDDDDRWERRFVSRGLPAAFVDGCPPGLRSKNDWCLPPGQYKQAVGRRLPVRYASQIVPLSLRDIYRDNDDYYWRYGDGYAYRVDRDRQLISSILPLIGAGLGIGMPFPYSSPNYYVPSYYQNFYPDSPYSYHRYSNGYVYEIDRRSGLIDDIVPLLDSGYGVGQIMPASYSYYNVPYPYRDYYEDDDDYYYRYAPGAIYQVDRDTQLITAIASLLMGNRGLAVGQPLPLGYDAYNVPYAYRDRYYDTPDSWYRYANGNIYQVDPTTRLITALVQAIV